MVQSTLFRKLEKNICLQNKYGFHENLFREKYMLEILSFGNEIKFFKLKMIILNADNAVKFKSPILCTDLMFFFFV